MNVERITREYFDAISGETDVIDRSCYGEHEIVVTYAEASGFTLYVVGPSFPVAEDMDHEKGSEGKY